MAGNIAGLLVSFGFIGAVLGLAVWLARVGVLRGEGARKFVHIASAHWVVIALLFFDRWQWAVVPPVCFVAVNWASYRWRLIKVIEREGDASAGTVWYAAGVLVCVLFGWIVQRPWVAACGVLAMGWGDGLAGLVGRGFGKHKLPPPFGRKSAEGSAAVFCASFVCVFAVTKVYGHRLALAVAFVCAAVAMLAELVDWNGLDNLTVPVCVTLAAYFMPIVGNADIRVFSCLTLLIGFGGLVFGQLSVRGMVAAWLVGGLLYVCGGGLVYAALIGFFIVGALAGRVCDNDRRREASRLHVKGGARGAAQVLANGFWPVAFAFVYRYTGEGVWLLAAFGSIAGAMADTLAGDFGMAFGGRAYSLIPFKPVRRGLSGGVTLFGLGAGVCGAAVAAAFAPSFGRLAVWGAGCLGMVIDSLLGGALQVKYSGEGGLTEVKNGKPVMGLPFMNNDAVNFIANGLGGLACLLIG